MTAVLQHSRRRRATRPSWTCPRTLCASLPNPYPPTHYQHHYPTHTHVTPLSISYQSYRHRITQAANVLKELPRLARAVKAATGAEAVNIVQNNGRAAGQARWDDVGAGEERGGTHCFLLSAWKGRWSLCARSELRFAGCPPDFLGSKEAGLCCAAPVAPADGATQRNTRTTTTTTQVVFHAHFHVVPRNTGDDLIKLGSHGAR